MRRYYIYKQKAKCVNVCTNKAIYRWLPFECLGYVVGTMELWKFFNRRFFRYTFHNSFSYSEKLFERKFYPYSWFRSDAPAIERYLIVDDNNNIRDYYQLTKKYRKSNNRQWRRQSYQYHHAGNISEQRCSITPEEIKEYREEYGVAFLPIKPKRRYESYDLSYSKRISRGWKRHSKRKRQYVIGDN